ncbi:histidine phosphatase family protein [Clostridia bacterium]|nr:histidine phosphatase family protein [Clostridia bacterium]
METKASFTLYLMRHGETVANKEQRYLGSSESPLTELGISQHHRIMNRLSDIEFERIYTSPRKRCLCLAEPLAKNAWPPVVDERIRELDFGVFELLYWQVAKNRYPGVWEKYGKMESSYCLPEGESLNDFESRIADFAEELLNSDFSGNVAVVSHGGVATTLICQLLGFEPSERWHFRLDNGQVAKIRIQEGFPYLIL